MPVEFECPYCNTTLQTPREMMGILISCGKCNKQVGVPRIAIPVSPSSHEMPTYAPQAAVTAPSNVAETPLTSAPVFTDHPTPPATAAGSLDFLQAAAAPTPVSRAIHRRKKSSGGLPWVPIMFLLMAVGLGGLGYWMMQPSYKIDLEATRLSMLDEHRIILPAATLKASERQALTNALPSGKLEINSSQMNTSVSMISDNLNISVQAGDQTELVIVDLLRNEALRKYVIEHSGDWDQNRLKTFQSGLRTLLNAAQADSLHTDPSVLAIVRDQFVIAGLSGGLSDSLQATIKNTIYPCVGQDSENRCYFIVPRETRSFTIVERVSGNSPKRLPASFQVNVFRIVDGSASQTQTPPVSTIPTESIEPVEAPANDPAMDQPAATDSEPQPAMQMNQ